VTHPPALRLATLLLAEDGLAALHLAGLVGDGTTLAVALVVAATWWNEPLRNRVNAVPGLARGLVLIAALASAIDLGYVASSTLDGLARLLLFLLVYRLAMRSVLRDLRDVAFLAFFMLVAAAPFTFGVGYLFVFLVFLVVGTWMLMLYHVAVESERAPGRLEAPTAGLGRELFGLSLGASVATLVITAVLFFVIPRIGQAALTLRLHATRMVTGFSDRVELGSFGQIETDSAVAMRVSISEQGVVDPERLPNLRWRGVALDTYDGRAWFAARRERPETWRSPTGQFELGTFRATGPALIQEVYLEPFGTDRVFAAPRLLRLSLRANAIVVDDTGGVSVPNAAARFRYIARSELESDAGQPEERLDAETRARFLQLPPLSARVRELARDVTAGARGARDAAEALTGYLAGRYRYTRALRRTTTLDPVEEFLFVQRSGNCEYFAASLAVMLRSLGIPARVVNGFQRGEWNPYGRYFVVRLLHAHSWVEAHVDGDWATFDPSPRAVAEPGGTPAAVALYLDALRVRWYRYVVSWSLQDQVVTAVRLHQAALGWRLAMPELREWRALPRAASVLLALAALVAVCFAWSRRRPAHAAGARADLPRFYARALRTLGRHGLRLHDGETAREFARRVETAVPTCAEPLARLTGAYERVRFGRRPLTAEETTTIDRSVLELRSQVAPLSGHPRSATASRPPIP
jgi:transglutaminase-like putative cysteine protease